MVDHICVSRLKQFSDNYEQILYQISRFIVTNLLFLIFLLGVKVIYDVMRSVHAVSFTGLSQRAPRTVEFPKSGNHPMDGADY